MSGTFRFAKSIVASIVIAFFGFAMHYGQSFLIRDVEDVRPNFPALTGQLSVGESQSVQRSVLAADDHAVEWEIAVVTNRIITPPPTFFDAKVTGSLTEQVKDAMYETPETTYGTTSVKLPLGRRRGTCKANLAAANAVEVEGLTPFTKMDFLNYVGSFASVSQQRDILVFVHGFNVSLEDATVRAAQIAEDMPFHGSMIAFSWQSAAKSLAYLSDEMLAERFFWNLAELLADLRNTFPNARLHVLAHSMGNRVTLRAIESLCGTIDPAGRRDSISFQRYFNQRQQAGQRLEAETSNDQGMPTQQLLSSVVNVTPAELKRRFPAWGDWRNRKLRTEPYINTLIMAAPDVAVQEFRLAVGNIKPACGRMILYASDTDYALHASRKVHGNYRAGDSRAATEFTGVHTVHVTGVDTTDPLGHSYYGSNPGVLDQLAYLLNQGSNTLRVVTAANTNN